MNGSLPELRSENAAVPDAGQWVELLRTLADPIRLRILRLLEQQVHHGLSVGELADVLKLPQSTVSRHLKTLGDAGLASVQRDGTSMLYRLSDAASKNSVRQLRTLTRQHMDHDPLAQADAQRLAHVLRQREDAAHSFFGKAAPQWDQLRQKWFGPTFHLEAMLALLSPHTIVGDLGAGTGAMLPLLSPHVQQVIAVEPSGAMLKAAKIRVKDQRLTNVDLRQGTLEQLPLEPRTLDVALVLLVLHHVVAPAAALKEVHRVLKPGGVLLICDLQPHSVAMFREQMGHRWMGFQQTQLGAWLGEAGFEKLRWHALPSQAARAEEGAVPDLFVMRAEAA